MSTSRICATAALSALLLAACSGHAGHDAGSSSAGLPKGDIGRGQELASSTTLTGQSCISCHGNNGNAPIDPSYPKIGGQYYDYLAHALQRYRDGKREHMLMSPQARNLTDQHIADLAAYFGSREGDLADMSAY
ncbi:cytochrome C biogenesis protein CcsA [Lysobacteraceae bacterium NML07-0707]|nr:cytochrome C biogenesis protein CcsA [Xanthomonadaceae bacterium NML07-0707]